MGWLVGSTGNGATTFLYDNGVYTSLYSLISPTSDWSSLSYAESI